MTTLIPIDAQVMAALKKSLQQVIEPSARKGGIIPICSFCCCRPVSEWFRFERQNLGLCAACRRESYRLLPLASERVKKDIAREKEEKKRKAKMPKEKAKRGRKRKWYGKAKS